MAYQHIINIFLKLILLGSWLLCSSLAYAAMSVAVGDVNQNGTSDIAVVKWDIRHSNNYMHIVDGNGSYIKKFFLGTAYTVNRLFVIDSNGDGANEIGLVMGNSSGVVLFKIYNAITGRLIKARRLPVNFGVRDVNIISDINGNASQELIFTGIHTDTKHFVDIFDGKTASRLSRMFTGSKPLNKLIELPDQNGNGAVELMIVSQRHLFVRDTKTRLMLAVKALNARISILDAVVVGDVTGDGRSDVALQISRTLTGPPVRTIKRLIIFNPVLSRFEPGVAPLPAKLRYRSMHKITSVNGNRSNDVAIFETLASGRILVRIVDPLTRKVIRKVLFPRLSNVQSAGVTSSINGNASSDLYLTAIDARGRASFVAFDAATAQKISYVRFTPKLKSEAVHFLPGTRSGVAAFGMYQQARSQLEFRDSLPSSWVMRKFLLTGDPAFFYITRVKPGTTAVPIINRRATAAEWRGSLAWEQPGMLSVFAKHDGKNIYLLFDLVNDMTNTPNPTCTYHAAPFRSWSCAPTPDSYSIDFDINHDGLYQENANGGQDYGHSICTISDPAVKIPNPTPDGFQVTEVLRTARVRLVDQQSSYGCGSGGKTLAKTRDGFSGTFNEPRPHRWFEVSIPLDEIGMQGALASGRTNPGLKIYTNSGWSPSYLKVKTTGSTKWNPKDQAGMPIYTPYEMASIRYTDRYCSYVPRAHWRYIYNSHPTFTLLAKVRKTPFFAPGKDLTTYRIPPGGRVTLPCDGFSLWPFMFFPNRLVSAEWEAAPLSTLRY